MLSRPLHRDSLAEGVQNSEPQGATDLIPSFGTKLSMIFAKERETSMSRSRHTEAQMIAALKQEGAVEVCRILT